MKNKLKVIIRLITVASISMLLLANFLSLTYGLEPGAGGGEGSGFSMESVCVPDSCGGGNGGWGGYHPPPDIWEQDPPDADGVYAGHPPDKDDLIQPGDLVPDLCEWIYGYHCSSVGRDNTLKQDWIEDPQSDELYDPYAHNAPGQLLQGVRQGEAAEAIAD